MATKQTRAKQALVLLVGLGSLCAGAGFAAERTKQNNGNRLELSSSWVGNNAPGAGDIAVFSNNWVSSLSVQTRDVSWLGLKLFTPGGNVTISGNGQRTLTLGSAGVDMSNAGVDLTFGNNLSLALAAAQSWTIAPNRQLTVTGGLENNGHLLALAGAGNVTFNGAISGTGGLSKSGSGTLILAANNTFSGGLTINGGIVQLNHAGALNATTPNAVTLGGGTLRLNGYSVTVLNLAGNGVVENASATAATLTASNATGSTTLSATLQDGAGGGVLRLIKTGAGSLTVSGNNTYSGGTTLTAGTLLLGQDNALGTGRLVANGGTLAADGSTARVLGTSLDVGGPLALGQSSGGTGDLSVNGGVNLGGASRALSVYNTTTFSGIVSNGALVKDGPGVLVLGGANTYAGGTVVSNGILRLGAANRLADTGALTVSGGTFDQNGHSEEVGTVLLNGGVITGGTLTGSAYQVQSGTIASVLAGTAALAKTGSGTVTLTANNTYGGLTTVSAGTLIVSNTAGTGLSGTAVTVAGGRLIVNNTAGVGVGADVAVGAGGNLSGAGTVAAAVSLGSGGVVAPGNSIGTIHFGSFTLNGGAVDFEFAADGSSHDLVRVADQNGLVINAGTVNLYTNNSLDRFDRAGLYNLIEYNGTISGVGLAGLSIGDPANNRTYSFGIAASHITLVIGGAAGAGWNPGPSSTDAYWNNPLNWGGGNGPVPVAFDQLLFDGNFRTVNTNNFAAHTRFTGIVFTNTAGNFALHGNALNLVGNIVNHSTKEQAIHLALVIEGGTRTINAEDGDLRISGPISGADAVVGLVKQGAYTLELTGNNTYAGLTEIAGGVLRANSGQGLPTASNLKISDGILESIGAATFTRSLGTGAGSLQFSGAGGFAARDGKLTVNIGGSATTLLWGESHFLASDKALVLGSATANHETDVRNGLDFGGNIVTIRVQDNAGSTNDFARLSGTLQNGGLTKTGAGKLLLSGNNTYTGLTTVQAGTLVIDGSLGANLWLANAASLSGSGTIAAQLSGSGTVAPGASPGILTLGQIDPSAGLDFIFEFTSSLPNYAQPTDSLNDILRLTNATPFTANLTAANTVQLHISGTLTEGVTNYFRGGFYTDSPTDFISAISNAAYAVYLNGTAYGTPLLIRTVDETDTQFGGQNGFVMEFGVVTQSALIIPEPSVLALWLAGLAILYAARRRWPPRSPATRQASNCGADNRLPAP